MSILDTNLAVILDQEKARRLGYTDEQLFEEVAKQIRRIPGVKQVYEYSVTRAKLAEENPEGIHQPYDLHDRISQRDQEERMRFVGEQGPEAVHFEPDDRMRGDIYP